MENFIEIANTVFYVIFVVELVLKVLGLGFASYFRDSSNKFDFLIVLLSTADICVQIVAHSYGVSADKLKSFGTIS